jgi:hypothetical protein
MSFAKSSLLLAVVLTLTTGCAGAVFEPADVAQASRGGGGGVGSTGPGMQPNSARAPERTANHFPVERKQPEMREPRIMRADDPCRNCGRGYGR